MPEDRRLAAIMFTDIVGYTALMGKDEDRAFQLLRKNRDIQRLLIKKYHGEWLKEMGDGILASFSTSSDAVRCSIEIQKTCMKENILLRIGIHEGEVVFEGSDIFGDGVNVASRLQEVTEEGTISISDSVYKDIKNKKGISTDFIEEKVFKNVDEPVKIYKVYGGVFKRQEKPKISPTKETKKSIAVLPFVNISNDPEQEYFCDGMTEEIINVLSHVERLKVIARTSAFMFKDKHGDVREIGSKLDVETLLEGSVRKAGNRIRITAQLVRVSDGSHIWSEAYNRELEDIFDIQEEISLAIVDNLKVKLLGTERVAIKRRHTENLEAYNFYLEGKYYAQFFTSEGYKKAFKCFELSIQKDPNYPQVYLRLALIYINSTLWGNIPPNEAIPKAKEYINKALKIDRSIGEIYSSLGCIAIFDLNWKEAEKEFKKALKINPNSSFTHHLYALFLTFTKRHDEAIRESKQAIELDPLSVYYNMQLGISYFYALQIDKSIEILREVIKMNPNYFLAHYHLGHAYEGKKMIKESIEEYQKAADLSGRASLSIASLACCYYIIGEKEKAAKLYSDLEQKSKNEYVPPLMFYSYHLIRGDLEKALYWFEKSITEHDVYLGFLTICPTEGHRIPDDIRFNKLMKKVGLSRIGT